MEGEIARHDRGERGYGHNRAERAERGRSRQPLRFPWDDPPEDPAAPPSENDSPAVTTAAEEPVPNSTDRDQRSREQSGIDLPTPDVADESPRSPAGGDGSAKRNPPAVAGFVLSLVFIPVYFLADLIEHEIRRGWPFFLPLLIWLAAVVLSAIGLGRAPGGRTAHRRLAIAGLCISLGLVVGGIALVLVLLAMW